MRKQGRAFYLLQTPCPFVDLQIHPKKYIQGKILCMTMLYRTILSKEYLYLFYKEDEKWEKQICLLDMTQTCPDAVSYKRHLYFKKVNTSILRLRENGKEFMLQNGLHLQFFFSIENKTARYWCILC